MIKSIIENTHIISSKVTKFIWLFGYNNFFKMDMYFETERVLYIEKCRWRSFENNFLFFLL